MKISKTSYTVVNTKNFVKILKICLNLQNILVSGVQTDIFVNASRSFNEGPVSDLIESIKLNIRQFHRISS